MPVIDTEIDREGLTLTVTAEFIATPERVWQLWADPRQLERWWGPPGWPASFPRYEFEPGGEARYFMTGPQGERSAAWFRFETIEAPHRIELVDGFSGDDGEPTDAMPSMRMVVEIEPSGGSDGTVTTMSIRTIVDSLEHLEQITSMGMVEGMTAAMNQIDELVA
ncbi:SRPBCC family protein [Microcella alkalica]|uniref:SRPBCC family protein n=1 Tax=Microcella alkalica TaxID=355930 RepID=UPI00145D6F31|nr:SRPBCC domain-containing protein [Microcella alkalica]